jgi:ADP-heptose:LPS heptosyltransferase
MKILCICPIGIGNYLLCWPAFSALKQHNPRASLQMLALREGVGRIARSDTLWDKVHVFDPTNLSGNIRKIAATIWGLRRQGFDACLNYFPSNTWQYNLLPVLLGIKNRYGFKYHVDPFLKLSFLCNKKLPVAPDLHDVRQNLALTYYFVKIAPETSLSEPLFPKLFKDEDIVWARNYRASVSKNSRFIGLHPGSSSEHGMDAKRWAPESFAGLADKACAFLNAQALIFGSADETALMKKCAEFMTAPAHCVTGVSLCRTAALLSLCCVCVCNDSGLMHIAACQGTPTVGIFGPTDEKRNGPMGARTLVIRKKMKGFPVWTALNVGDRRLPKGVDPGESLRALSSDEAWDQMRPWLENPLNVRNP